MRLWSQRERWPSELCTLSRPSRKAAGHGKECFGRCPGTGTAHHAYDQFKFEFKVGILPNPLPLKVGSIPNPLVSTLQRLPRRLCARCGLDRHPHYNRRPATCSKAIVSRWDSFLCLCPEKCGQQRQHSVSVCENVTIWTTVGISTGLSLLTNFASLFVLWLNKSKLYRLFAFNV
jgi:hypothetical protein